MEWKSEGGNRRDQFCQREEERGTFQTTREDEVGGEKSLEEIHSGIGETERNILEDESLIDPS